MSFDAEQTVYYNIANTPVREYPFPHFYVENVFPDSFYRDLLAKLPPTSDYMRIDERGEVPKGMYPERFICDVETAEQREFEQGAGDFWERFRTWISGPVFAQLIMHKFRDGIRARYGEGVDIRIATDTRLVRDFTNYSIPPHTDAPRKMVSLLFYLPADESFSHLGTSLFVPRDPEFRCEGTKHHGFANFLKVATAPFRPNSLLAFLKNDLAFHGVEPIGDADVERNVLLYNIYVKKIVFRGSAPDSPDPWAPRSAPTWPWQRSVTP